MRRVFFSIFGGGNKNEFIIIAKFGEKCIIMKQEKLRPKLENCAILCIWLGYADFHAIGIYHVLKPKTRQVMLIQDAVFKKEFYFDDENDSKKKKKLKKRQM